MNKDIEQLQYMVLFLMEYIKDIEEQIHKNRSVEFFAKDYFPPWEPKYGKLDTCPKCGIQLTNVMSYNCNNVDCPTGFGPVWCKS